MATNISPETVTPVRRPYKGSCHCGNIRYILYLTFPLVVEATPTPHGMRMYKCNCSTCLKMGILHVRPANKDTDFMLLSPLAEQEGEGEGLGLGGLGDLGDYMCNEKQSHWPFCKKCGVRCFIFTGEGEISELDEELRGLVEDGKAGKEEKIKVWRTKTVEGGWNYLSINGTTLEYGQEGLNLKEWTEKGWIYYVDSRADTEKSRFGEPHEGGMY